MPPTKPEMSLGNSWVVAEEEDYTTNPSSEEIEPVATATTTRPNIHKSATKSPDPEFIMPSLNNSLDGSAHNLQTHSKTRNTKMSSSGVRQRQQPTRDSPRDSPEKRSRMPLSTRNFQSAPNQRVKSHQKYNSSAEGFLDLAIGHITSIVSWMFDVLGGALRILKTPISYLLAVWLLFGLGLVARNLITNSVYASLSPLCRIPGSSLLNLPFCENVGNPPPPHHVEFDQLMAVQSNFEQVLEESAGGVSLPLDMKRGEASIRDLRQLVRYSHLHSK